MKIAANSMRIDRLDNKYDFLVRAQMSFSPADKPKAFKIESE